MFHLKHNRYLSSHALEYSRAPQYTLAPPVILLNKILSSTLAFDCLISLVRLNVGDELFIPQFAKRDLTLFNHLAFQLYLRELLKFKSKHTGKQSVQIHKHNSFFVQFLYRFHKYFANVWFFLHRHH